tara:strand:+ start:1356 stop:1568 length:213 start_codon:yes stop_codon:yes gene_type:complete
LAAALLLMGNTVRAIVLLAELLAAAAARGMTQVATPRHNKALLEAGFSRVLAVEVQVVMGLVVQAALLAM